jgi:hypothetical protein
MTLYNDCYPCILRQTLEAAQNSGMDTGQEKELIHGVMRTLLDAENSTTSPEIAQQIHRYIRKFTGVSNPYAGEKYEHNRQAMELLPELRAEILGSDQPLLTAARYAIAGNVIDFGVSNNGQIDIHSEIESALKNPLGIDHFNMLQSELHKSERVIYLGDNSGEIVFDRLLIETILDSYDMDITYMVRGEPVLNDVTMADARQVGLDQIVQVIDNGTDAPGTVLSQVPEDIRTEIESADVIIAKGQGNFESLIHVPLNIFFLFKVKCSVIAEKIASPLHSYVIAAQHYLAEQMRQSNYILQDD